MVLLKQQISIILSMLVLTTTHQQVYNHSNQIEAVIKSLYSEVQYKEVGCLVKSLKSAGMDLIQNKT